MKSSLIGILLILISVSFSSPAIAGRRCTGSSSCNACTNCNGCKYCNEGGGTCGVCGGGDSYKEPIEQEVESTPTSLRDLPPSNEPVRSMESYYPSQDNVPEEKPTSYTWLWWVLGIGGFLLLGIFGKK